MKIEGFVGNMERDMLWSERLVGTLTKSTAPQQLNLFENLIILHVRIYNLHWLFLSEIVVQSIPRFIVDCGLDVVIYAYLVLLC